MRKLIKFILIFLLVIVLIVVGIVAGVYISLTNKTDDTPTTIYSADASKENVISAVLSEGFNLNNKKYIDITLNENELNLLLFCIIREKINDKYLPLPKNEADYSDEKNYIWASKLENSIPVVGGKGIIIKSAYAKIDGEQLKLFMPALIGTKASCVELYLSFEEDNESFYLKIDTLKIGRVNYASKGTKKLLKIANKMGLSDEMIEEKISGEDLKFDVSLENLKIGVTKDSLSKFLNKLITDNVNSEESTRATLVALADMITSKENDILDLGIFNDRFGIRCDLTKADVDEEQLILNTKYTSFDEDLYITSITQSFAIANIGATNPKITISEDDFNAMIYAKSNGYHDFKADFPIPNTEASISIAITGIDIDLDSENIIIDIILNLNGLKTVIELAGRVSGNNTSKIIIALDDEISIGKGKSEATASYISASSDFIKVILAEKIDQIEMMEYDKNTNSLVLNADNFNEMLSVTGGSALPLAVKSLALTDSGLDVYVTVTNPIVAASLEVVTDAVSNFLESSTLTSADFNTTDPKQAEAVSNVLEMISSTGTAITSGTVNEEKTGQLIEAIQELSDENKQALYESVEESMSTSDLESLYNSLFGK